MRLVSQGPVTLIIGLTVNPPSGYAYTESFFNKRYYAMGGSSYGSAMADCSFNTWEQCRASVSGLGRYCTENSFWKPESSGDKKRTKQQKTKH
jgi:hypothetical protein